MKNKHDQALAAVETIYGDKLRELEARFTAGELDWYDRLVREELVFKDKGFREGYLIGVEDGRRAAFAETIAAGLVLGEDLG